MTVKCKYIYNLIKYIGMFTSNLKYNEFDSCNNFHVLFYLISITDPVVLGEDPK